jgi:hypothetical protein
MLTEVDFCKDETFEIAVELVHGQGPLAQVRYSPGLVEPAPGNTTRAS